MCANIDNSGINKSDSVELSRELNSIFRYCEQSAMCYTYLADVLGHQILKISSRSSASPNGLRVAGPFKNCWQVGRSASRIRTGMISVRSLPWHLLSGTLRTFETYTIGENAASPKSSPGGGNRETQETEDVAYSLLGVFGVTLAPIYGEGENAFQRLQLAIIDKTDDESIFAWRDDDSLAATGQGLLAISPFNLSTLATSGQHLILRNRRSLSEKHLGRNDKEAPLP